MSDKAPSAERPRDFDTLLLLTTADLAEECERLGLPIKHYNPPYEKLSKEELIAEILMDDAEMSIYSKSHSHTVVYWLCLTQNWNIEKAAKIAFDQESARATKSQIVSRVVRFLSTISIEQTINDVLAAARDGTPNTTSLGMIDPSMAIRKKHDNGSLEKVQIMSIVDHVRDILKIQLRQCNTLATLVEHIDEDDKTQSTSSANSSSANAGSAICINNAKEKSDNDDKEDEEEESEEGEVKDKDEDDDVDVDDDDDDE